MNPTRTRTEVKSKTRRSKARLEEPEGPPMLTKDKRRLPNPAKEINTQTSAGDKSFINDFYEHGPRMRKIVAELQENAKKVREMKKSAIIQSVCGGVVIGAGAIFCCLNPVAGAAVIAAGGTAFTASQVVRHKLKKELTEEVKKLRQEFSEMVESLVRKLEEIHFICKHLKKKSSEKIEEALRAVRPKIKDILGPGKNSNSADSILRTAELCQEVTDEFEKIKVELLKYKK